jgi:hypothetical protein
MSGYRSTIYDWRMTTIGWAPAGGYAQAATAQAGAHPAAELREEVLASAAG